MNPESLLKVLSEQCCSMKIAYGMNGEFCVEAEILAYE